MTAQTLLHDLATRSVILSVNGDQLEVDGPDEALTGELLATLRDHKAELLDLLASGRAQTPEPEAETEPDIADEPERCPAPDCNYDPVSDSSGPDAIFRFCPAGHFRLRLPAQTPVAPVSAEARKLVVECLARRVCPACRTRLDLQSKNHGFVLWCANCRHHWVKAEWSEDRGEPAAGKREE